MNSREGFINKLCTGQPSLCSQKFSLPLRSGKTSILLSSLYHLQHSSGKMSYSDTIIFLGCLFKRYTRYTHQRNKSFYRCIVCSSHLLGTHLLSQKRAFLQYCFQCKQCSKADPRQCHKYHSACKL